MLNFVQDALNWSLWYYIGMKMANNRILTFEFQEMVADLVFKIHKTTKKTKLVYIYFKKDIQLFKDMR